MSTIPLLPGDRLLSMQMMTAGLESVLRRLDSRELGHGYQPSWEALQLGEYDFGRDQRAHTWMARYLQTGVSEEFEFANRRPLAGPFELFRGPHPVPATLVHAVLGRSIGGRPWGDIAVIGVPGVDTPMVRTILLIAPGSTENSQELWEIIHNPAYDFDRSAAPHDNARPF